MIKDRIQTGVFTAAKQVQWFALWLGVAFAVLVPVMSPLVAIAACNEWVKQAGPEFRVGGRVFRFAGSNNYYLMYKSQFMVDDVLNAAASAGFTVMRARASIDIGNQDGSNSNPSGGKADGVVYFQFFNNGAPAYNDGVDGLQHLDYLVYRAGQLGIRLVLPMVNNWKEFGGIDQYVTWRGGQFHDDFYTDATIRQWFKHWISHLLNHVNPLTNIAYKDDPTIMAWELANEPRCGGSGLYPASPTCNTQTLVSWADDISHHFKKVAAKPLLAVGDEGFYCTDPTSSDFTINCSQGVDAKALAHLPRIDFMSFHLYPELWGKTVDFGTQWIQSHFSDAHSIGKPAMLGEYGLQDAAHRNPNYKSWTDTTFQSGGAGALYWILSARQDDGTLYPDFDHLTVYCPSPVCTTESNFAAMMTERKALSFPPVADNDAATTPFATPVTLTPPGNDTAYAGASLVPSSLDLDPVAPGQQITLTEAAGTFALNVPDGSVVFTPASGFSGTALASYTIQDSLGRTSNPAALTVTVKPPEGAPTLLFSFEDGVEGWGPASFESPIPGTVVQSTDFHTDGTHSLRIDANRGAWWGVSFATALDLSGNTHLKWDVNTTMDTTMELAIQSGDAFSFCQGPFTQFLAAGTSTTIDRDLGQLSCTPDLTKVHSIFIFMGNGSVPGPIFIDNIRAEAPHATVLDSFETGVEGWAAASFESPSPGTVQQSTDFHTDGNFSLRVDSNRGAWWGVAFALPVDLSGTTHIRWDVEALMDTTQELAIQSGDAFSFCQGPFSQFLAAGTTTTIDRDLTTLSCTPDLTKVHAIYIFMGNGSVSAPIYIDRIVVQ
jgi:mannan endo-1,4-beta-mannosidase